MQISLMALSGDNVKVGDTLIKHPQLKDLKQVEEIEYSRFIRVFCAKPFDVVEDLYEAGFDYEKIGHYELFNMLFTETYFENSEFRYIFNMFFDVYYIVEEEVNGVKNEVLKAKIVLPEVIADKIVYSLIDQNGEKEKIIDENNFAEISDTIKTITGYSNKTPPKFHDEMVKEMYIEDLMEEAKIARDQRKNNSIITMADLIGAIILDTAYTYETVWDMYLYQFHSCTRMILKREDYKNTMTGIYTGNLDPKKVNMKKIYWLNKD